MKVDEKLLFKTILRFTAYWVYKPTYSNQANFPGVYTSDKILNFKTKDENHMECVCIIGSVENGTLQPRLSSSDQDKPPVCKVFYQPETVLFKKLNKYVRNTITFYLEDDDHKEVFLNGKTLTFSYN